jgi:hypothetical protein
MPGFINLTGKRFSRLVVIKRAAKNLGQKVAWLCKCDCGNTQVVRGSDLKMGKHRSCGCLQLEAVTKHGNTQHGKRPSLTYTSWQMMKTRCLNPAHVSYPEYGGRGITFCQRWNDFSLFLQDMGARPSKRHSIERIETDGNYEPENCYWATPKQQAANRRKTKKMRAAWARRKRDALGRFA